MFTGLIQAVGVVKSIQPSPAGTRLTVEAADWDHQPSPGDSISISGCCLTVVSDPAEPSQVSAREDGKTGPTLSFDIIPESLAKTMLGGLVPGGSVNLEHAVTASTLMGGHTVQGHVDEVGQVSQIETTDGWRVRVSAPQDLMRFMIPKGSVTIDGVSLTLAQVNPAESWIEVALIPETLERTTLRERAVGDAVNLEADIMVKTIVHTMEHLQSLKAT